MSVTVEVALTRDNNSRQTSSGANKKGRGGATTLDVGKYKPGSQFFLARAHLLFPFPAGFWDNVERVTAARLKFTMTASNSDARVRVRRRTKNFSEGSSTTWEADEFVTNNINSSLTKWGSPTGTAFDINAIEFVHKWAPGRVLVSGKGAGRNEPNKGFSLIETGSPKTKEHFALKSGEHGDTADHPVLEITYEEINAAPIASLSSPTGNVDSDFVIAGGFSGPEASDIQTAVNVEIRDDALTTVWAETHTSWVDAWEVSGPPTGTIPIGDYEVRARVKDSGGRWSEWLAWTPFTLASIVPGITATPLGQHATMSGLLFVAPFVLDPTGGKATKVDIQLQELGGAWDSLLWDESYVPTEYERNALTVETIYRGTPLLAGQYEWRVRVTDEVGNVSLWAEDATLDLLIGVPPDESELDLTTGYDNLQVRQRIVLYGIFTGNRGPSNKIVGIIENPSNMGVMWNATSPGQLWFTLPADHPQVSNIEPWVTHYQVEQYRRGAWKVLQYGLINDFDAQSQEVVFMGTDYLGLLTYSTEAAIQPEENPRKNIGTGVGALKGSRYFNKTIRYIIKDQLKRARLQESDSPVKFVQIGRVDKMDEKITIYAHYRQRLNFIRGLIDSHRGATAGGGGEKRSRLRVRWNPNANDGKGQHQFELLTDTGKDRDNILLEYGGLLQNYQVIAYGDFLTRAHGVGYEPNASRPHFAHVNSPGVDREDFGTLSAPFEYVDVVDKKDLKRRTRQAAIVGSRVGKSVALALRVDGLDPFDGWALLDAFPILIQDGVVDTTRYGSGYWVVWKTEWFVYPDGHDELRLTVRPKGDTAGIDPDLIPSDPIHFKTDWKWGHGDPPATYTPET